MSTALIGVDMISSRSLAVIGLGCFAVIGSGIGGFMGYGLMTNVDEPPATGKTLPDHIQPAD